MADIYEKIKGWTLTHCIVCCLLVLIGGWEVCELPDEAWSEYACMYVFVHISMCVPARTNACDGGNVPAHKCDCTSGLVRWVGGYPLLGGPTLVQLPLAQILRLCTRR